MRKGQHQTESAKLKMSLSRKKLYESGFVGRLGCKNTRPFSEEYRKNMSNIMKGRVPHIWIDESRIKLAISKKILWNDLSEIEKQTYLESRGFISGIKRSDEFRKQVSDTVSVRYIEGRFPSVAGEYNGIKMRSQDEIEFALFLDSRGISWEYQRFIFKMPDGFNYIPDFRIVETNEFVEVKKNLSEATNKRCAKKMDAFIDAGYVLHLVKRPFVSTTLSEDTLWRHNDSRKLEKVMEM